MFVNPLTAQHKAALTPASAPDRRRRAADSRQHRGRRPGRARTASSLRATRAGDFSTYRLSARHARRRRRRRRRPASTRCCRRSTSRSRSTAPATSTAGRAAICPPEAGPPIDLDYLARDYATFRRLLLDRIGALDARLAGAARGRPRRSRWSSCSPTSATTSLPPGRRRDRGVPRHGAPAHLGPPPRPARRLRDARRLQRPGLGPGRRRRHGAAAGVLPAAGRSHHRRPTRFLTRVTGPRVDRPRADRIGRSPRSGRRSSSRSHDVDALQAHNRMRVLHAGATEDCCLPAGATRATLDGNDSPTLAVGDVLSSRRCAGPGPASRPTPTRPTATPCG